MNVLNDTVIPTEWHSQTVMINVNFHEHGMCLQVLIQKIGVCPVAVLLSSVRFIVLLGIPHFT